ncbi:MAG: carboxylate--amine ligase [Candidatus Heimdallarchaeaceae archaeon]
MNRRVLITNANYKNSLAMIRSLGKRGIEVLAADSKRRFTQGFYSKYCKKRAVYTDPKKNLEQFIDDIITLIKKENIDVLMPVGVNTTIPISYYKDELEKYTCVPVVDYNIIIKAHDKSKATKIADKVGVPVPKTFYPESSEDLKEISNQLSFPVVIKARKGTGIFKFVYSKAELIETYDEIQNHYKDNSIISYYTNPLIQEYIPGKIHDVCVLFKEGKVRAALTQMRIKTNPPEGGPGVVNVTTYIPELRDLAINLMEKIRWHGVAQLEFKHDPRDNKFKLLEINPKFWGTLGLSIEAGIDFPYLLYKMTVDGDTESAFNYRKGLKFRWIVPNELNYLRQSRNKLKDLQEFLKFWERNTKTDIWMNDLKPNIFQVIVAVPYSLYRRLYKNTR